MEEIRELGKLLFSVGRLHMTRADQFMEKIGLFHGQGMLLKFIARHDGMTHSEVADRLMRSPAAVTKVIKRLEELQFLRRQADSKDERISRIFIQPEGLKKFVEIDNCFQQLDKMTFQGFSEIELDQIQKYLMRMQKNLQNNLPEPQNEKE
jgi:MarR family transcriptional regulator for hemolysin